MNKLEVMEVQINSLEEMYKKNLKRKIRLLMCDLENELERLENDKGYFPNTSGILQHKAISIDELCIKLGLLNNIKY